MILHIQLIPRSPLKHEASRTWSVGGERVTCIYIYIYIYICIYVYILESTGYVSGVCIFLEHVLLFAVTYIYRRKKQGLDLFAFQEKRQTIAWHTHTHTHKHFRLYFRRSIALARPCQKLGLAPRHGKKSTNIKADTLKRTTCLDISRPLTPASVVASQRYASTTSKRPPYASCFTGLLKHLVRKLDMRAQLVSHLQRAQSLSLYRERMLYLLYLSLSLPRYLLLAVSTCISGCK
jgi:hypothetical protein